MHENQYNDKSKANFPGQNNTCVNIFNTLYPQCPLFKVFFIFTGQNFGDDMTILKDLEFRQEFKQTFGQKEAYPTTEKYAQTA